MKRFLCLLVAACLLAALVPATAVGSQPEVNLGLTSFLDGGPPAGPGFYFTEYIQYYTSDLLANPPGPIPDFDVDVWVSLNQFIYQSNQPVLFGGKWGLDVIVPLVCIDSEPLPDNGAGIGDVLVGPFIQWDPIMGENGPIFMHRVEFQTVWPVGRYNDDDALNPGSNFFSFNPYWAGTYWLTPKLTASWRLHYLWNDENDDPWVGMGVDDTQAGDAVHANFAASYELIEKKLRLGLNGYYFKQLDESEVNGTEVSGKEEVCAIGPGLLWSFSQDTHLFFNAYFETDSNYRPEGERFVLRLVHHFKN